MNLHLCMIFSLAHVALGFNVLDYAHYFDYLPYRQEGLTAFEDFRTAPTAPTALRNRKMEVGSLLDSGMGVEEILESPVWPTKWPYGFEDFRPCDYTRDDVINTLPQYQYSQSLITSDHVTLFPGLIRVPIRRHFIMPKDKVALAAHYSDFFFEGAKVLELFSVYESILPPGVDLGPTVGIGWSEDEMRANPDLDDYIQQDISVDPFLPLASNYFDFVIMPANFQLLQRPRDMFREINRVLKPGGTAFCGVKLALWSFLGWKQGRYYVETNYFEDVLALGSFFHYAGGFSKPESIDLTLPELNIVGKCKDVIFPQPRLDFYAVVQAKKKEGSPHGTQPLPTDAPTEPVEEGLRYKPRVVKNPVTKEEALGPFY
jgi:SAM-dependent methyltransferase